ncbi:MAG TPA: AtpZ/AtpI family protein [Thermoguttaceae bacterium]
MPTKSANFIRHFSNQTCLPVDNTPDGRSPLALALEWVSRITAIAMEMVLPIVIGYWIDKWLGTKVVFLILGLIVGFVSGIWNLVKLTK